MAPDRRDCATSSSSLPSCLLSYMSKCTIFFGMDLLATESGVLMMSYIWTMDNVTIIVTLCSYA